MAITLVFHGGLFTVLAGRPTAQKVDVHMRLPERVQVTDKDGKPLPDLETAWSAASRLDFESPAPLKPDILPIRPISHLIPIDYNGFHKTVGFMGGTMTGAGGTIDPNVARHMQSVKRRWKLEEMLGEFQAFARVPHELHEQGYLTDLVQAFFAQVGAKDLRTWMADYCVEVRLPARGTQVVVNGYRSKAQPLPDGLRVEFPVDPHSTIPHYPLGNPHVLEQPPTR